MPPEESAPVTSRQGAKLNSARRLSQRSAEELFNMAFGTKSTPSPIPIGDPNAQVSRRAVAPSRGLQTRSAPPEEPPSPTLSVGPSRLSVRSLRNGSSLVARPAGRQAQVEVSSTPKDFSVSNAEHDRLKADVTQAKTTITGFNSGRLGNVAELSTLEAQLQRIRRVFQEMDEELTESGAELLALTSAVSRLEQEKRAEAQSSLAISKALQDELASAKVENVSLVQAQKDSQDRAARNAQQLRDEIMSLEQDKYFLNEFCMAKQTEANNLNDDFKAQWEFWETQLESLKSANDSLQQTIERQSEEATQQSREHQSIVDDLKEEHASLIEHQQQQHSEYLDKIDDLEDERTALQEEAARLREEHYASLKEAGDTIDGLQQEVLALGEANSTLEEHLSQAQFTVESLTLRAEELEETTQHVEQEYNNQAEHRQTVLKNAEAQNQRLLQELELAGSLLNKAKEETVAAIENGKKKEAAAARDLEKEGRAGSLALAFVFGVVMGFIALFGFYYCKEMEEI
ncbi:hypothetical protein HII31_12046 [Pseudocercospora fuligena]|uniref:Uncharacterized protein n=1 Tax=Pseudocercospora fuligena TaxID=685502 RepID=A0A8H6RA29_9PEZI|nr:hypothetical protein HII31_12046 [Pseudocercospora fuligena]